MEINICVNCKTPIHILSEKKREIKDGVIESVHRGDLPCEDVNYRKAKDQSHEDYRHREEKLLCGCKRICCNGRRKKRIGWLSALGGGYFEPPNRMYQVRAILFQLLDRSIRMRQLAV
jgi:hypothetical protein